MGPWPHMALNLTSELPVPFYRVSRPESTSPAVGSAQPARRGAEDADAAGLRCVTGSRAPTTDVLHRPRHRGAPAARGDEEVTLAWLADRLQEFVDLNPEFEVPVERLATWLARLDDEDDDGTTSGAGPRRGARWFGRVRRRVRVRNASTVSGWAVAVGPDTAGSWPCPVRERRVRPGSRRPIGPRSCDEPLATGWRSRPHRVQRPRRRRTRGSCSRARGCAQAVERWPVLDGVEAASSLPRGSSASAARMPAARPDSGCPGRTAYGRSARPRVA